MVGSAGRAEGASVPCAFGPLLWCWRDGWVSEVEASAALIAGGLQVHACLSHALKRTAPHPQSGLHRRRRILQLTGPGGVGGMEAGGQGAAGLAGGPFLTFHVHEGARGGALCEDSRHSPPCLAKPAR
jgi:hypothetical protein